MKVRKLISFVAWGALVVFMLPAAASKASAHEGFAQDQEAVPLEGNQCWARCSTCAARCGSVYGPDHDRCERICQAGNDRCCESSGRHGSSRSCGCY